MSFVTTQPEMLAGVAGDFTAIGSAMSAADAAAAAATIGVGRAAADEVSVLTATQFDAHASLNQTVITQAVAVQDQFVAAMGASARSYAATEAANASAAG